MKQKLMYTLAIAMVATLLSPGVFAQNTSGSMSPSMSMASSPKTTRTKRAARVRAPRQKMTKLSKTPKLAPATTSGGPGAPDTSKQ
jgi:hypothetical protein